MLMWLSGWKNNNEIRVAKSSQTTIQLKKKKQHLSKSAGGGGGKWDTSYIKLQTAYKLHLVF